MVRLGSKKNWRPDTILNCNQKFLPYSEFNEETNRLAYSLEFQRWKNEYSRTRRSLW